MKTRTLFLCLGALLVVIAIAIYFFIPQESQSSLLIPKGAIEGAEEKQFEILQEGLRQLRGELPENTYIYEVPKD